MPPIGHPRAYQTALCWRSLSRLRSLSPPFLSFLILEHRQRRATLVDRNQVISGWRDAEHKRSLALPHYPHSGCYPGWGSANEQRATRLAGKSVACEPYLIPADCCRAGLYPDLPSASAADRARVGSDAMVGTAG